MSSIRITSFYKFTPLEDGILFTLSAELESLCRSGGILGLIVLAPEGINATVAGDPLVIDQFKRWIEDHSSIGVVQCKDSSSDTRPFRRLRIDRRAEIVTLDYRAPNHSDLAGTFLTPAEWHARMQDPQGALVLDLRNRYEIDLGKFRAATNPEMESFTDLPAYLERSEVSQDREILMYCTGGVRCEKATALLRDRGFSKIRQLAGGILKYLEEFPSGEFEGECFVFDHRVAVDSTLKPSSRYTLCVHCGDPADRAVECNYCGGKRQVCARCFELPELRSCSKNCAYHLKRRHALQSA